MEVLVEGAGNLIRGLPFKTRISVIRMFGGL